VTSTTTIVYGGKTKLTLEELAKALEAVFPPDLFAKFSGRVFHAPVAFYAGEEPADIREVVRRAAEASNDVRLMRFAGDEYRGSELEKLVLAAYDLGGTPAVVGLLKKELVKRWRADPRTPQRNPPSNPHRTGSLRTLPRRQR
jgi:hypothetical protein